MPQSRSRRFGTAIHTRSSSACGRRQRTHAVPGRRNRSPWWEDFRLQEPCEVVAACPLVRHVRDACFDYSRQMPSGFAAHRKHRLLGGFQDRTVIRSDLFDVVLVTLYRGHGPFRSSTASSASPTGEGSGSGSGPYPMPRYRSDIDGVPYDGLTSTTAGFSPNVILRV